MKGMIMPMGWLVLDKMEKTMNLHNIQDIHLPMNSLQVNQKLQCMLQQMIPLSKNNSLKCRFKCLLDNNNNCNATKSTIILSCSFRFINVCLDIR